MEYLIDTYQHLIFSICYKITGNYFDSEDLAQDTFLSAYKNLSKFDGKNEKAWICRIATNKSIDYQRKSERKQIMTDESFFLEIGDEKASLEEKILQNEVKERLLRACKSLKPPYDEIAEKYFYYEIEVSKIAQQLNRNEKTVQTQIYRAKAMLRKIYCAQEGKWTNGRQNE